MPKSDILAVSRRELLKGLTAGTAVLAAAGAARAQGATRPFTHDRGTTEIPVSPQRIVALNDVRITIPLLEFGVTPVGSHGNLGADGTPYLRSGMELLKAGFAETGMRFVGAANEIDWEAVAALEPDLIIQHVDDDRFAPAERIAPTVAISRNNHSWLEMVRMIADSANALPAYERLTHRLDAQIAELRTFFPQAADTTVAVMQGDGVGTLFVFHNSQWGALGYLLDTLGFKMPKAVTEAGQSANYSVERIADVDADFVLAPFSKGATPRVARDRLEEALPSFCDFLHACRNDQFIHFPRDIAYPDSFSGIDQTAMMLIGGIAGRKYVPLAA